MCIRDSLDSVHPAETLTVPMSNLTHLAPTSFANSTVQWDVKFSQPLTRGQVPAPSYYSNISFYFETSANLSRTNDTHLLNIEDGAVDQVIYQQPEYYFD